MIGDRFYMREPTGHNRSAGMIVFWSLVVVFFLQGIDSVYNAGRVSHYLSLSLNGIKHGYVWQFLTFQFLHAGMLHIIFNLFTLYFFGLAIEQVFGTRRFLQIYFGAGLAGGVLQMLLTAILYPADHATAEIVGASAGIYGLIAVAALTNPYQSITFWGIFPIRVIWYLTAMGLISLYFTILPVTKVAHAAHLGGILFGLAYVKWFLNNDWAFPRFEFRGADRERELVSTPGGSVFKKSKPKAMPPEEDIPAADFMSKEVDPILDKISAHGIQSLTDRERRILEAARAKMAKR
jgi:membrane associated rhomboid family serine protease